MSITRHPRRAAAFTLTAALISSLSVLASACAPSASAADSANATTACDTHGMSAERFKLAQGYSLLYDDADEITTFNIEMKLKSTSKPVGKLIDDYMNYNQTLKKHLRHLAHRYPAVKVKLPARSDIEEKTRFAIGKDYLIQFAPIIGDTGATFERKALLFFITFVDEQRHLVAVLHNQETNSQLQNFLQKQHSKLDALYTRFDTLLNHHYFKHPDAAS